jgi:ATP synthase protein I
VDKEQRTGTSDPSGEASRLPNLAPGLPDVAPRVSDEGAESGASNDGAEWGVLDERATSKVEGEHQEQGASPASTKRCRTSQAEFCKEIGTQERRKLRAQRGKARSIWLGLGMLGLIGWSVAIPALAGVALGVWIDTHFPSRYSWTLMLLLIGTIVGCLNAWRWVANEQRQIHEAQKNHNQDEHRGNNHS